MVHKRRRYLGYDETALRIVQFMIWSVRIPTLSRHRQLNAKHCLVLLRRDDARDCNNLRDRAKFRSVRSFNNVGAIVHYPYGLTQLP